MNGQWIVIRNWDRFQHYKGRRPVWIRAYTEILEDPSYYELPESTALLLHRLWLAYASSRAQLPLNPRSLSRRLNMRVTSAQLERLNHAGFIEFSASKPLAERYQDATPDKTRLEKKELSSSSSGVTRQPNDLPLDQQLAKAKLLSVIGAATNGTVDRLESFHLPPAAWHAAAEELQRNNGVRNRVAYTVTLFATWAKEGRYGPSAA